MSVEFICQDCGLLVYTYFDTAPEPPRCSVCQWISEAPPEHHAELRRIMRVPELPNLKEQ